MPSVQYCSIAALAILQVASGAAIDLRPRGVPSNLPSSAPGPSGIPQSPGPALPPGGGSQGNSWTLVVQSPGNILNELVSQQVGGGNSTGAPTVRSKLWSPLTVTDPACVRQKGALVHFTAANATSTTPDTVPWVAIVNCDTDPIKSNGSAGGGDILSSAQKEGALAAVVWSTISSDCATSANYDPAGHIPVYTVASPQGVAEIESAFGPNYGTSAQYWFDPAALNSAAGSIARQLNATADSSGSARLRVRGNDPGHHSSMPAQGAGGAPYGCVPPAGGSTTSDGHPPNYSMPTAVPTKVRRQQPSSTSPGQSAMFVFATFVPGTPPSFSNGSLPLPDISQLATSSSGGGPCVTLV